MSIVKKLQKFQKKIKSEHVIALLGLIGVFVLLREFSNRRKFPSSGMQVNDEVSAGSVDNGPEASKPLGQNEDYAAVAQSMVNDTKRPDGTNTPTCNPADLLPIDQNNEWAKLNPTGAGDLDSVNLLRAGEHAGIDTVGGSLRNANLQIRSEPANPIPDKNLSQWNIPTIGPDLMRQTLEIGNNSM